MSVLASRPVDTYDMLPTTLQYASWLAGVIKRMLDLDTRRAYPFRLFM